MARDNGSRGSYRHTNATEPRAWMQQAPTLDEVNKHSPDENATAKANETLNDHKYMDSCIIDHLADHATDLLNAQFPPMHVPGSMPRRQTDFFRGFGQQPPAYDWKDVTVAVVVYGLAGIGFIVIMCDGIEAIGGLLIGAGAHLMHKIMLQLGD